MKSKTRTDLINLPDGLSLGWTIT